MTPKAFLEKVLAAFGRLDEMTLPEKAAALRVIESLILREQAQPDHNPPKPVYREPS